jgi:hypothetical protein
VKPGRDLRSPLSELAHRGVEVRLSTGIAEITPGKVTLADGPSCPATSRSGRPASRRQPWSPAGRATDAGEDIGEIAKWINPAKAERVKTDAVHRAR